MNSATILRHYQAVWGAESGRYRWGRGPVDDLPSEFDILEFSPRAGSTVWVYATCGLSACGGTEPIELHLFAPDQEPGLVELLTVVAHYHCTGRSLGVGHIVTFGRSWLAASRCTRGLVSLPYVNGPRLEYLRAGTDVVRCLWLLPITEAEADFAISHGADALEHKFDEAKLNYYDPNRKSVV